MHLTIPPCSWVWLLVLYLWATGGLGWVKGYEFSTQRPLKPLPRTIAHVLWPIFSGISVLGEWYAQLFPGKR